MKEDYHYLQLEAYIAYLKDFGLTQEQIASCQISHH